MKLLLFKLASDVAFWPCIFTQCLLLYLMLLYNQHLETVVDVDVCTVWPSLAGTSEEISQVKPPSTTYVCTCKAVDKWVGVLQHPQIFRVKLVIIHTVSIRAIAYLRMLAKCFLSPPNKQSCLRPWYVRRYRVDMYKTEKLSHTRSTQPFAGSGTQSLVSIRNTIE